MFNIIYMVKYKISNLRTILVESVIKNGFVNWIKMTKKNN